MGEDSERRDGMAEVLNRLSSIESRLSRIEGGLALGGFLFGIAAVVVASLHL